MRGLGDVLKYADPKWYPGFDKTTQLYNSLNMGKTPVGSGGSSPTFGGKTTSLSKCADMAPEEPKFPPGVKPDPNTPEIEIPYLAHANFAASRPGVHSSGTAVYKWKIFLNYKFSTADPAVLGEAIKYAFTEDDFKNSGTKFDKKTKLATEKYSYIFRNWALGDKDMLGVRLTVLYHLQLLGKLPLGGRQFRRKKYKNMSLRLNRVMLILPSGLRSRN